MQDYSFPADIDIKQLRIYLQDIYENKHLTDQEKYNKTYEAVFDSKTLVRGREVYYTENGGGWHTEIEKWEWLFKNDNNFIKFIDGAKYHVPPNLILNKYQKVMDDQKIDIAAVTQLEKRVLCEKTPEQNFYSFVAPQNAIWTLWRDYMDEYIKLPDVPNCRYMLYNKYSGEQGGSAYSAEKTEKFLRALNERGEDYILKFMLIVMLRPGGNYSECLRPIGEPYYNPDWGKDVYDYAHPSQARDFRYWYQAWDRLVPTMCQRYEAISNNATFNPNLPQNACGSLIHEPRYQVTQKEVKILNLEHPDDADMQ